MAARTETNQANAQLDQNKQGAIRRMVNWVGEKSTYITFPISAVVAVGGAVTGAWGAVVLGSIGMGTDIIQNRYFKAKRANEAGGGASRLEHSTQQDPTEASNLFIRKLYDQLFGSRQRRGNAGLAMSA